MSAPTGEVTARVTRREMVWVVLWAVFIMLLTCVPYLYAQKLAGERTFGGFLWGVDEGNVYLTWMRQAAEGDLVFRNQYTTEPEKPHFINLFLQFGGRLSGLLKVRPVVMFHVLRLLGGMFLLVSFYRLTAEITRDRVARWAALALASLGSGFGWLIVLKWPQSGIHPVDVGQAWQIQPEAVTFPSLLFNGLFTTSMALMCLTFLYAIRALREGDRTAVWRGGLCLLVLGNIHTYDVFVVWLVVLALAKSRAMHGMARDRHSYYASLFRALRRLFPIILIGLPSVAWAIYATFADRAFLAKGLTPTLAFRLQDYVVAYGLIGLLALVSIPALFRQTPSDTHEENEEVAARSLPLWWLGYTVVLLFIPVSFQRKMIEGLHLPLCILAGLATSWLASVITTNLRRQGKHKHAMERIVLTVCAITVFCIPSNALLVSQCLQNVKTNNGQLLSVLQPPIYLEAPVARAMEWLGANARREDIIVSSSLTGSYIPTYCPAKVWIGHWAETLHFQERLADTMPLFAPLSAETLRDELRSKGITLVFYSVYEQQLTRSTSSLRQAPADYVPRWLQAAEQGLQKVYDHDDVRIYRVPQGDQ